MIILEVEDHEDKADSSIYRDVIIEDYGKCDVHGEFHVLAYYDYGDLVDMMDEYGFILCPLCNWTI